MNIRSMLVRLQGTLGRSDLVNQMVLLPQAHSLQTSSAQEINLVVGYSSSPRSQTALDLTLWIAHQTRLATGKQVTVQVVYVGDKRSSQKRPIFAGTINSRQQQARNLQDFDRPCLASNDLIRSRTALAELPFDEQGSSNLEMGMADVFERADRILWQARCLADEWRGSLKTHLRFGSVDEELRSVVQAESASLLILGCESAQHPLVQQLGKSFPCPVLGIPSALDDLI
ncbi:MAG: universal stress protein [Phormidesmis sp. CAN_BIN36]|nr:universal stress protein [Phormidesmis sp. CAN_BIN36]